MKDTLGEPTTVIDIADPEANMYGCSACPECKNTYRYPVNEGGGSKGYRSGDKVRVSCDDCGHTEMGLAK